MFDQHFQDVQGTKIKKKQNILMLVKVYFFASCFFETCYLMIQLDTRPVGRATLIFRLDECNCPDVNTNIHENVACMCTHVTRFNCNSCV